MASVDHLLTQTCTIERWVREVNSQFELEPDWQSVATAVPCLVQEKTGRLVRSVAGREVTFSAIGYFPAGTDLRPGADDRAEGDRITVDQTGATYCVQAVDTMPAGRGGYLRAWLQGG